MERVRKSSKGMNIGLWLGMAVTLVCNIYLSVERLVSVMALHETGVAGGVTPLRFVLWLISGILFLELIIPYMDSRCKIFWGMVFAALFFLGYPLSCLLYGCSELGMAIDLIMAVMLAARCRKGHCVYSIWEYLFVFTGIIGFVLWFQQGLPFILTAAYPMLFGKHRDNRLKSWIPWAFVVFVFLAGMLWIWMEYGSETAYYNAYCGRRSAVYNNLWSDAGIFLFFIVLYFHAAIKKKMNKEIGIYICTLLLGYACPFIYAVLNGRNSFDGYNLLYLLWIWVVYVSARGFFMNYRRLGSFLKAYMTAVLCVFVFMLSGAEQKLQECSIWYCVDVKSDSYLKVYAWNFEALKYNRYSITADMEELYQVCRTLLEGNTGNEVIPYIGEDHVVLLENFYRQTNQEEVWRSFYALQPVLLGAEMAQKGVWDTYILSEYDVPYVVIEKDCDLYWYGIGMYGSMEVVYENEYGMVLKF